MKLKDKKPRNKADQSMVEDCIDPIKIADATKSPNEKRSKKRIFKVSTFHH